MSSSSSGAQPLYRRLIMMLRIGADDVSVDHMVESTDVSAARDSLAERGYALLRGVIPPKIVEQAGQMITATLAAEGWLHPGTPREELVAADGVRGGMLPLAAAHSAANHPAVRRCLQGPEIFQLFGELFGEPAVSLDFKWFRAIRGHATSVSGAGLHMDRKCKLARDYVLQLFFPANQPADR